MEENNTKEVNIDPEVFIDDIVDPRKRLDCKKINKIMRELTGCPPKMWGDSIIGYGKYKYKYESGKEGEFFIAGFSPRKHNITIYLVSGFEAFTEPMSKLGKFTNGKSCLYIKNMSEVSEPALRELIKLSVEQTKENNTVLE